LRINFEYESYKNDTDKKNPVKIIIIGIFK